MASAKGTQLLSFELANKICQRLLPIAESASQISTAMREFRFAAFQPYCDFVESFGNEVEVGIHRKYIVESAKQKLGCPWPRQLSSDERNHTYKSHFIDGLKAALEAETGVSQQLITTKFPGIESLWLSEVDPCRRNMVRYEHTEPQQYRIRLAKSDNLRQSIFIRESEYCRKYTTKLVGFDMEQRFYAYRSVMDSEGGELGFHYDERISRPGFPVYSKQIAENWRLCWTLLHIERFALTPLHGTVNLSLDVRSKQLAGGLDNAHRGDFLQFRYQDVVPGFDRAYWKFENLKELETIVKANLQIFKIMSPILESAIAAELCF